MSQTLTVNVPSELYVRLKKRADDARRSVEEETIELLAATIPGPNSISADLMETLASLELLDDATLERTASSRLAEELASELELLHFKKQREGLTPAESLRCEELVQAYERAMLLRAQAAALLKERGHDVSHLIAQP